MLTLERTSAPAKIRTLSRISAQPPLPAALLVLGMLLWLWALAGTRVDAMGDTGLVSVLPARGYLALAVVTVSFVVSLSVRRTSTLLLAAHPLALVTLLFATPPLLYGSARYSWAWKHAGVVDYIDRFGSVNPDLEFLSVYHSWPGFFSFNAVLVRLTGLDSAMSYAAWAEVFFNGLTVLVVWGLMRALTGDARTTAVGAWLFTLANWVGQGYWSPQAISYVWYLLVLALLFVLMSSRSRSTTAVDRQNKTEGTGGWTPAGAASPRQRAGLMAVVVLLLFAIVSTHQLTPVTMILVLTGLVIGRRLPFASLPLLTAVLFGAWLLYVATPFSEAALREAVGVLGAVGDNLEGTLIAYSNVSSGQRLVSLMARLLSVVVGLLALAGFLNELRKGRRHVSVLVLVVAPLTLVAISPYGSEVLFRTYLFALPGFVFYAAMLVWPPRARPNIIRQVALATISLVLVGCALLAVFGSDERYHFTPGEVAASRYVQETAVPNTLLVEGSRNYPSQFARYEKFVYVPMSQQPPTRVRDLVEQPVRNLLRWTSNEEYAASFIIITRSQIAEDESMGTYPPPGLAEIEAKLSDSPRFREVLRNRDAVVFVRADADDRGVRLDLDAR